MGALYFRMNKNKIERSEIKLDSPTRAKRMERDANVS